MAKKKSKRVNPNRKPAHMTEADVRKIKDKATEDAMMQALRLVLYTLIDKHNAPKEDIQKLAEEINYMADSVSKGYVKWADIDRVLDEEYEIVIELK